jgi:hypothetical protein
VTRLHRDRNFSPRPWQACQLRDACAGRWRYVLAVFQKLLPCLVSMPAPRLTIGRTSFRRWSMRWRPANLKPWFKQHKDNITKAEAVNAKIAIAHFDRFSRPQRSLKKSAGASSKNSPCSTAKPDAARPRSHPVDDPELGFPVTDMRSRRAAAPAGGSPQRRLRARAAGSHRDSARRATVAPLTIARASLRGSLAGFDLLLSGRILGSRRAPRFNSDALEHTRYLCSRACAMQTPSRT